MTEPSTGSPFYLWKSPIFRSFLFWMASFSSRFCCVLVCLLKCSSQIAISCLALNSLHQKSVLTHSWVWNSRYPLTKHFIRCILFFPYDNMFLLWLCCISTKFILFESVYDVFKLSTVIIYLPLYFKWTFLEVIITCLQVTGLPGLLVFWNFLKVG